MPTDLSALRSSSDGAPASSLDCAAARAGTSVGKALVVVETLIVSPELDMGVSDVARRARLPKSTTYRLLRTLEEHGWVEQIGSRYRLGARLLALARHARQPRAAQLQDAAAPVLERLFERTNETVHLAVPMGSRAAYLEKITAPGGSRLPSRVGCSMPLSCTGVGKALLAFGPAETIERCATDGLTRQTPYSLRRAEDLLRQLVEVRRAAVAYDHEESCLGMACVAAPVLSKDGSRALAAVSVAGPTGRFRPERAAQLVRDAARAIAAAVPAAS